MKFKHSQQKLAAVSLVEVLVVLALIAVFIVGAAQMTVRLVLIVKNNEIYDYVNGLQIQALEIAKSPAEVMLTRTLGILPPGYAGSYSIRYGAPNALLFNTNSTTLLTNCPDNSIYRVNVSGAEATSLPSICLQFVIQPQQSLGNNTYYQITTRVVYSLNGQVFTNDLVGYRSQDFTILNDERTR